MTYRPDIDGLRTIAVMIVVFFHAGISAFSGGYVGVDVFFVISGYLITGIIYKEINAGTFSIVNFYERRIRRIFPALIVVVFASSLAAYIFLMPIDLESYAKSAVAAVLSFSNFFFLSEAGYFNGPSDFKPLLHTWSLSVEEQFYLLLPLALLICQRFFRAHTRTLLVAALAVSLVAACLYTFKNQDRTFFLLPFRAWELLMGSVLAVYKIPSFQARALSELEALAGLLMIVLPALLYTDATVFPGVAAVLPVLGTALLIHSGQADNTTSRVISARPLVAIGLISYSVYLWHWPIIVFIRHTTSETFSLVTTCSIVVASLAAGYLSYRFVEKPFRDKKHFNRKAIFSLAATCTAVICAIGAIGALTSGLPSRLSDTEAKYAEMYNKERYFGIYDRGHCFLDYNQLAKDYPVADCARFTNTGSAKKVLIFGDSFAAHYYPGLKGLNGVEVRQYTATSCRPILTGDRRCDGVYHRFLNEIIESSKPDVVVISALWPEFVRRLGPQDFSSRLEATVNAVQQHGVRVVLVGQSPTFERPVPYIMAKAAQPQSHRFTLASVDTDLTESLVKAVAAKTKSTFFSPYGQACQGHSCIAGVDGHPFHWDFGHMTLEGSSYYAKVLGEEISRL
jgi:peptidoglycan/LPS O-acetylase OafA/YrhL